jgi:hypothetical protein
MTEQTTEPRTVLDTRVVRQLAHAMWAVDLSDRQPDVDPAQRKDIWTEEKREFTSKARRIIRQLNRKGLEFGKAE